MTKKSKSWYKVGKTVRVNDRMQKGYKYKLVCPMGKVSCGGIDSEGNPIEYKDFKPYYSPGQMLKMGVFEGKYINDCKNEFPKEWYEEAERKGKLSPSFANPDINYFGIKSRLSLQEWKSRGWVPVNDEDMDIRGWFQWFCRYWIGRRQPSVDIIQIKRWKAFKRHFSQVEKNAKGQINKRRKQRQALLQWSWNAKI